MSLKYPEEIVYKIKKEGIFLIIIIIYIIINFIIIILINNDNIYTNKIIKLLYFFKFLIFYSF